MVGGTGADPGPGGGGSGTLATPKLRQMDLAWPMWRYPLGSCAQRGFSLVMGCCGERSPSQLFLVPEREQYSPLGIGHGCRRRFTGGKRVRTVLCFPDLRSSSMMLAMKCFRGLEVVAGASVVDPYTGMRSQRKVKLQRESSLDFFFI